MFVIRNDGIHAATDIEGKQFIISNINDQLVNHGFVSLSAGGATLIPNINKLPFIKPFIIEIDASLADIQVYFYIQISYRDIIIPSKKYYYNMLFSTIKGDTSDVALCKNWEQHKIEKFLGIK
jgi:hypothetical protein